MRIVPSLLVAVLLISCQDAAGPAIEEGVDSVAAFIEPGSAAEAAVLDLVNDSAITATILDDDVRLDVRAANNIVEHRTRAPEGAVILMVEGSGVVPTGD